MICVSYKRFFLRFLFLKIHSQWLHLRLSSYLFDTKGHNGAVAVIVDVIYSSKAEFEERAAVIESMAVQTAIETGSLFAEAAAWLWVS